MTYIIRGHVLRLEAGCFALWFSGGRGLGGRVLDPVADDDATILVETPEGARRVPLEELVALPHARPA